jgi:mitogen-activated protein kinase 1/3
MSDVAVAKPAAAVPEPAVPEANVEAEAQIKAAKAKHSHSQSQSQPRKVRFNVGSNYKVLEIIGEGVSTCSALFAYTCF